MNILHVVYDEKFVMFAAEMFEACEDTTNRYLVLVDDSRAPFKYVSGLRNIRAADSAYLSSKALAEDLKWCDSLVVHYLGLQGAKLMLRAPSRTVVAWSGWGGDYNDLIPGARNRLIGKATLRLLAATEGRLRRTVAAVPRFLWAAVKRVRASLIVRPLLLRAIRRADLFSAPISEDFALMKSVLGDDFRADYAQINYGSVERTFALGAGESTGDAILIGNSASASNNHVEVLDALSKIDIGARNIVVPLSYGDASYRDAIVAYGRKLFGHAFQPITDYKPLDEYNGLLAGCSVALMGHRRQQGLGNIITMLHIGASVVVDRASPVYECLTRRGAFIFGLDELERRGTTVLSPLTPEQKRKNRAIVRAMWGHDVVTQNARRFVAQLRSRREARRA